MEGPAGFPSHRISYQCQTDTDLDPNGDNASERESGCDRGRVFSELLVGKCLPHTTGCAPWRRRTLPSQPGTPCSEQRAVLRVSAGERARGQHRTAGGLAGGSGHPCTGGGARPAPRVIGSAGGPPERRGGASDSCGCHVKSWAPGLGRLPRGRPRSTCQGHAAGICALGGQPDEGKEAIQRFCTCSFQGAR